MAMPNRCFERRLGLVQRVAGREPKLDHVGFGAQRALMRRADGGGEGGEVRLQEDGGKVVGHLVIDKFLGEGGRRIGAATAAGVLILVN
jgi:hypothetical protein